MAFGAFASTDVSAEPAPRRRSPIVLLLLLPGTIYLALTYVAPLVSLVLTSLMAPSPTFDIGQYVYSTNLANYANAFTQYGEILARSFGFALMATILALVLGYPLAYFIGVTLRTAPLLQSLALVLVIAPFFISFLLRTLAWKQIFSDEGPVLGVLGAIGLAGPDTHLTGTAFTVVFGLTYNFLPFTVLPIYASLERLDLRYLEAGSDLYASRTSTFLRITLPLSMPGVVSGTLLTFIPATGDYINASPSFLGGPSTAMIGNVIEQNFLATQNYPIAAAMSIILMIAILIPVALYVRFSKTEDLL
ncbi:ABC transporter permease [Homoserinibacter sp. YIM 151385]|uniref:ABC transporter permease n=1 Tax=Homoserinibacter sp. YIM 151385 TaxID=2985506 RepID=UPI0022F121CD|nr:ABC transporter permease [Homoserinibacter sp. YIM 151385]WBU38316.1 ABC transporter permease [Homoserinibacter sp. YIM 151385]